MKKLTTFHHAIRSSSVPLVVSDEDGTFFVLKYKGAGDGVLANIIEWIASKLAVEVGVPTVEHALLEVDEAVCAQIADPEISEPLSRSIGINYGTKYSENAVHYSDQKVPKDVKHSVFLYDVFLLNIDRTSKNTNMILVDDLLLCHDFTGSLTLRYCIEDSVFNVENSLKELRKHPFYTENIDPKPFIQKLLHIPEPTVRKIIYDIPDAWIEDHFDKAYVSRVKQALSERLLRIIKSAANMEKSLTLLQTVKLQTEEERQKEAAANRDAFKKKFGKM